MLVWWWAQDWAMKYMKGTFPYTFLFTLPEERNIFLLRGLLLHFDGTRLGSCCAPK